MKYDSPDYVTSRCKKWLEVLGHLIGQPCCALEVGSHEGRSAIWFLENILTHPSSVLTCMDPWGWDAKYEANFEANMAELAPGEKLVKRKTYAEEGLRVFNHALDFSYLDGSKEARDFLVCAALVWPRMKPGGIVIFDDYGWGPQNGNRWDGLPPKPGIDAFLHLWAGQYELLQKEWQVVIRKKP